MSFASKVIQVRTVPLIIDEENARPEFWCNFLDLGLRAFIAEIDNHIFLHSTMHFKIISRFIFYFYFFVFIFFTKIQG